MGMAASQARYLGLTARKTNTEYEGQQINQARTALANQSANLWNRMLALQVPTAPKTTDYTTQQYAFTDGFNDYEIDSYQNVDYTDPETGEKYNYQVTYHYNQEVFKAIQQKNTNPQVQKVVNATSANETVGVTKNNENYTVTDKQGASTQFKKCTSDDLENLRALASKGVIQIDDVENLNVDDFYKTTQNEGQKDELVVYAKKEDLDNVEQSGTQESMKFYGVQGYSYKLGNSDAERLDLTDKVQKADYDQIIHDFPELAGVNPNEIWVYQKNGRTCYATESELNDCIASGLANQPPVNDKYQISSAIDYQKNLNQYYATHKKEDITRQEYARLDDKSGTGRYKNIKLMSSSESFALKSEETTDTASYDDAMNQYNYDILAYEKELADINAKTSKIQVQDRTLELRLKQLDTEQKALTTEMDAVKSVIQKNVEMTFKTFSS